MPRLPLDEPYTITQPFGVPDPNAKHGFHAGIDMAAGIGTPVYAPVSGVVTPAIGAATSNQGNVVEIFDGKYYPHSFHLRDRLVSPGQNVTEGQLVGHVGITGLTTGPHDHFGVGKVSWPKTKSINDYIDPMEYIKGGDMQEQIDALNDQLNQTNIYVGELQASVTEQAKQLDSTNKYLDKLTVRVTALEQASSPMPSDGVYELKKVIK